MRKTKIRSWLQSLKLLPRASGKYDEYNFNLRVRLFRDSSYKDYFILERISEDDEDYEILSEARAKSKKELIKYLMEWN